MATQELKSVTIRVPSNLLQLIEAKVSDRDTRTDVIISLLKQALEQPALKDDVDVTAVERQVSEVNQRVDNLADLLNSLRQQIVLLDIEPNDDRDQWVARQIESLESRLSAVEKSKSTIFENAQLPLNLNTGINEEEEKTQLIEIPFMEVAILANEEIPTIPIEKPSSIQTKLLAKRLGVRPAIISTFKKENSEEELYKWLQDKDPDKISWQPAGGLLKSYSKGWIPAEDTPSELLSKLKEWVNVNSD